MRKDGVRAAREAAREEVVFSPLCAREGLREARDVQGGVSSCSSASLASGSGESREERKEVTQEAAREGVNLCAN